MIESDPTMRRIQRFLAAWTALCPEDDDVSIVPNIGRDSVRLMFGGHHWLGKTIGECLDQAEAWLRSFAVKNQQNAREEYDRWTARQRDMEVVFESPEWDVG